MSSKWNRYHENLLKRWSEMSKTYSIMHSLCAQYYAKWHKRLGAPVVVIGGVTASSIFSSNKEDSDVWTYINGGLALLVTVLAGISNFIGTAEKTTMHQNASYKYTKIAMEIDTLLSFGRYERTQTPQEFIHCQKAQVLEIRENVPEVLPWVMSNYLKKFDKSLTTTKSRVNKKYTYEPEYIKEHIIYGNGEQAADNKIYEPVYNNYPMKILDNQDVNNSVPKSHSQPIFNYCQNNISKSSQQTSSYSTENNSPQRTDIISVDSSITNINDNKTTEKNYYRSYHFRKNMSNAPPNVTKNKGGEILLDFSDRTSTNMLLASEKIQNIHTDSEFTETEEEE